MHKTHKKGNMQNRICWFRGRFLLFLLFMLSEEELKTFYIHQAI